MSGARARHDNLLSVQILRAIAAVSVCAVHWEILSELLDGVRLEQPLLNPLAAGVDLFFVISGFVMVYSSESLFARPGAPATFLGRRIARIVPLYWATTTLVIFSRGLPVDARQLLGSYFFIPYMGEDQQMLPLYGVGWTLNYEMLFYLVFSAAIMLRREMAAMAVAGVLLGAIVLGRVMPGMPVPLRYWSDPIIMEFVFGMALALAYRHGLRLPRWVGLALLLVGAVAIWHGVPRQ